MRNRHNPTVYLPLPEDVLVTGAIEDSEKNLVDILIIYNICMTISGYNMNEKMINFDSIP